MLLWLLLNLLLIFLLWLLNYLWLYLLRLILLLWLYKLNLMLLMLLLYWLLHYLLLLLYCIQIHGFSPINNSTYNSGCTLFLTLIHYCHAKHCSIVGWIMEMVLNCELASIS